MASGKHKLIIINYYDALVNRVDIYTEEKLEIYTNDHLIKINEEEKEEIEDLKVFDLETATDLLSDETKEKGFSPDSAKDKPLSEFAIKINWPHKIPFKMKAHDYLNFMRNEMINQIEKVKKETLEYYETIKEEMRQNEKIKDAEELKKKLFAKRSAFLFSRPHSNLNPFTLYLLITDFYLNEFQLKILNRKLDSGDLASIPKQTLSTYELMFSLVVANKRNLIDIQPAEWNENIFELNKEKLMSNIEHEVIEKYYPYSQVFNFAEPIEEFSKTKSLKIFLRGSQLVQNLDCLNNLEYLFYENSNFPIQQSGLFRNLRNLKKLIIYIENKDDINEDAFEDLVNLEYLHLKHRIWGDPFNTYPFLFHFKLDGLLNLKWLEIDGFYIKQKLIHSIKSPTICVIKLSYCKLKENIFIENMPSLRSFSFHKILEYNEDRELEEDNEEDYKIHFGNNMKIMEYQILNKDLNMSSIFKLTNLTSLILIEYSLDHFEMSPEIFKDLNNLEYLNIKIHREKDLDYSLKGGSKNQVYLPKLTRLRLHLHIKNKNILQNDLFNYITNLKELTLEIENIEILDDGLFSPLVFLENLGILESWNGKMIQSLQANLFSQNSCLKKLSLSVLIEENSFNALEKIRKLEELILLECGIENLNFLKSFINVNNLKYLQLYANKIEILDDEIFSHLSCLECLDLFSNRIKEIRKNAFKGLGNLKKLDLSFNQIDELQPGVFAHLIQLEELYISDNKLKNLVNGVFSHLVCLKELDLNSNKIENIENGSFEGLGNLRKLDLTNNMIDENIRLDLLFRGLFRLTKLKLDYELFDSDKMEQFKEFFGATLCFK